MGLRHQARQCALMVLYGMDHTEQRAERALARFFDSFADGEAIITPPSWDSMRPYSIRVGGPNGEKLKSHIESLVEGVERHKTELDAEIQKISKHWRISRMARIDRNILRLGTYELMYLGEDVPRRVAINEALELAKTYSTGEARSFINGILDRAGRA